VAGGGWLRRVLAGTPGDPRIDALFAGVDALLDADRHAYLDEARMRELPARAAILALPRDEQIGVIVAAAGRWYDFQTTQGLTGSRRFAKNLALHAVLAQLLRRDLDLDAGELDAVIEALLRTVDATYEGTYRSALLRIAKAGIARGHRGVVRKHAAALRKALTTRDREGQRRLRELEELMAETPAAVLPQPGEPWSDRARRELGELDAGERAAWDGLLRRAASDAAAARPSRAWRADAAARVAELGAERFAGRFVEWAKEVRCPAAPPPHGAPALAPFNADLLRGLAWCAADVSDPSLSPALATLAEQTYKKIPGHGPYSRKVGNACLAVLGERGAIADLQRLAQRVKYAQARAIVDRTLEEAAARAGMARADLEDLSVPTFGLGADRVLRRSYGDAAVELRLDGGRDPEVKWIDAGGRPRAALPKGVKDAFPAAGREIRALAKEVGQTLRAQRDRLEATFLAPRTFPLATWRERWLGHPLLATLATALLWRAGDGPGAHVFSAVGGELRGAAGEEAAGLADDAPVRLWHPLDSDVATILGWRRRLAALGVRQPFKQAHREVYLPTPAELETRDYSNRFAAHVLKQHQVAALCRERGWRFALQGGFDSGDGWPSRDLPGGLRVEFRVNGIPDRMTEIGIFLYVTSDRVVFRRGGAAVPLLDVPPLVFSEAMREVDLFVGVASVANDPTWVDGGDERFRAYWQDHAFGELAETARTRRDVLAVLLPSLEIAGRCRLLDRFLEVRGARATYRIHLGSANVIVEPGSRYLCVVPGASRDADRVRLPFDGDGTLALILSKAFLLANDAAIRDESILRQIG
jgi:hypothetical protein